MKPFALRVLVIPIEHGRTIRVLAGFLFQREIPHQQFEADLVSLLSEEAGFDFVCFVGLIENLQQVKEWVKEGAIGERLAQAIGKDPEPCIRFLGFNPASRQYELVGISGVSIEQPDFIDRLRRSSLQRIFREANALVDAPRGTHYQKPSGKHVREFLRVSRVLESHVNVSEIAFWLLRTVAIAASNGIATILVDTSGILAIGHVLAHEALRHKWVSDLPVVMSHNSYQGLGSLRLHSPQSTVCVISASTSGALEDSLASKGIPNTNISTIYLLGCRPNEARAVLCDLTLSETDNPQGFKPIESFGDVVGACDFCNRKLLLVPVTGDQFVVEQPIVSPVDIAKADLTQRELLDSLVGTGLFRVFRGSDVEEFEIYLDVEALLFRRSAPWDNVQGTEPGSRNSTLYHLTQKLLDDMVGRFSSYMRRGLSVNVQRIVHGSHPYSEPLARSAEQTLGRSVEVLRSRDLQKLAVAPNTATLVVGASFTGGRELMAISQQLRGIQPRGNTTYLALLYRSQSKAEFQRTRSTITFGEFGPETFSFHAATSIVLPNCTKDHSWRSELELFEAIENRCNLDNVTLPEDIAERMNVLRAAPARGLEDNLFWTSAGGLPLRIQPDFVFVDTAGRLDLISQADIYVVVASLLHDLRQRMDEKQLVHGPYKRTVVGPENFARFNDPIIQAAVLRACRGYELAYANCDDGIATRMLGILEEAVRSAMARRNECLMEFLVAMATKRLCLPPQHTKAFCDLVLSTSTLPASYHLLAEYVVAAQG